MSTSEFDGQPMTKREVLIARQAFVKACEVCAFELPQWPSQAFTVAKTRYPLPKVTRPRVVKDFAGDEWRVSEDFALECRINSSAKWTTEYSYMAGEPKLRALIADLLANPVEEVEA